MTKNEFEAIRQYMLQMMNDSAHDMMHIYRVLNLSMEIAAHEKSVDYDILIAACLLHDIGREAQFADLELDHAEIGGKMAHAFLTGRGWPGDDADRVSEAIAAHRFRKGQIRNTIEAQILFDADKLDAAGGTRYRADTGIRRYCVGAALHP